MAMLQKGITFRRQGSSGLSWADNWTFTDDGMKPNDAAVHHHEEPTTGPMAPEFRVGKVKMPKPEKPGTARAALSRSVSVGPSHEEQKRKPKAWGFAWLKQKLRKSKS